MNQNLKGKMVLPMHIYICRPWHTLGENMKVSRNEKRKKKLHGFSYDKNMANYNSFKGQNQHSLILFIHS